MKTIDKALKMVHTWSSNFFPAYDWPPKIHPTLKKAL